MTRPQDQRRAETPTSVELFSGGGGLALGAHRAGFRHLLLLELDDRAVKTIKENNAREAVRPPWPIEHVDIHGFDLAPCRGADLLAAGPPCQPFSLGGQHRGNDDRRNLFPEALRAVREIRPKAVLFENVKGLVRPSFLPYFEYIIWQLERPEVITKAREDWRDHKVRLAKARLSASDSLAYNVTHAIVDASVYGVPQRRHRVVIVAFRQDLGIEASIPPATHSAEALLYAKWVERSYWGEHELPERPAPPELTDSIKRLKEDGKPLCRRWATVRDALRGLPEPVDGEDHPTILNHQGIPGARRYPGHDGSPLDEPAKTLKAGVHGVPGGEGTLLREDGTVRYFSVREAARMQTFPDEWFFHGSRTHAMRQIGNAVPVLLASALALHIRHALGQ